jgi:hypothetical protein
MTLDEASRLARQLPPVISIETAGKLVGMSRSSSYQAAARGELPLLGFGRRRVVITARWLRILGLYPDDDGGAPGDACVDQFVPACTGRELGGP